MPARRIPPFYWIFAAFRLTNLRFDILQAAEDPCRFLFYEVFASQEALEAHRQTPHYLAWRSQAENWMAKPREGRAHLVVDPLDPIEW